jgi:translocation-and-assembly-module (TAM) inner membrane subunit TamB-like protein
MSIARRSLQAVALVCTLIVGAASMAVIVTQTTWFKEWLRGFIVRQAEDYVNGRLSIGRLDGNLFFGVELEDVDVTMNGQTVVDIKDVGLDYNAFSFLAGYVILDDIRLNQPVFRVEKDAEGWNIARMIKARTPDPDEPKSRRPIEVGEIGISDGTLYIENKAVGTSGIDVPSRIARLDASLGVASDEDELTVEINHVSLRAAEPSLGINALSGVIRRRENAIILENVSLRTEETSLRVDGTIGNIEAGSRTIDIKASSDKFTVDEIARIIPALRGYVLQPAFEVSARGPLERLSVDVNAREATLGRVSGDLTVDAAGPDRRIAGTVLMEHLNIAPLVRRGAPGPTDGRRGGPERTDGRRGGPSGPPSNIRSDITGQAQIDLALPSGGAPVRGTYAVKAERVQFAGYDARNVDATGRIDGRVIRVNARANAYGGRAAAAGIVTVGQPVALDLAGRAANVDLRNLPPVLKMPGAPSDLQFTYTLTGRDGVYSGDVTLDASTLAGASIAPGTTGQFTLGGGAPGYAAQGQVSDLDVEQIGRGFAVPAIATDRFRSRINATFDVKGSGGGRYPLTLDATGTAVDSEMFGASFPRLDFTTNFSGGDARVKALGQFSGLDPAVITGNAKLAGNLSGAADVDTTIRNYGAGVTVDSLDASGRVNLGNSTFGGFAIDNAVIDGTYANREGQLTQLAIAGPDLNVSANGAVALNDTGASNLTAHLDSASLERLGEIIGRPLKGAAVVDTTITGNARELKAAGTLQGSNIGYGETGALSLNSTFSIALPELTPENASVQAKSTATFVEIGGQSIRELTADTTYAQSKLEFNAVAQEGVRQLAADGSAVFHPDHQEIHLANLALRAEKIEWRTTPGNQAAIRYGGDRIRIDNLQLVSGDQRIDLEGVVGSPDEVLRVRTENVDVAQLDQLLLGDQRLAGRLNATGTISGPTSALRAEGEFTLTQGAFRQFKFESLAGKVDYVGRGMNVDVRLQQTPQAWLTATGYAPLSLFRRNPTTGTEGHETPAAGEAIELQVASSQIDLGVVQGFTTYVTNVTGALQANVKVTGTGHDPHLDGVIDIRGGAFEVPDLGTSYTGLDTRVDLRTDALTISEMRILDEHKQVMTVGGTLAVHERSVGAVDVKVQSENFEVIHNQLADLKLDTDVRVTGELRAPRVEGFVEVQTGTIDVARVLEQVTTDPYATEALELDPQQPAPAGPAPTIPRTKILDALDLTLGIAVPSNLVLRGTNLRPVNAPIDMGDMNATVGGAIQVRKAPGQQFRLTGEVNTVRGSYTFQGRRFEILRDGRIRFAGTEEIDPQVDLRARRLISGVEVFVRVQGTMRQPELSFTSNPPQDQADILSLIVFNMPANELGEGQQISLAERAGALAGGYLISGLTRSLADALELDEFEIQAQGERSLGPTLSIGEQVGERLFFRIRQGFGAEQATEFILEYQIADFLRLQGAVAETAGGTQRVTFRRIERGGLDLIFFFSY